MQARPAYPNASVQKHQPQYPHLGHNVVLGIIESAVTTPGERIGIKTMKQVNSATQGRLVLLLACVLVICFSTCGASLATDKSPNRTASNDTPIYLPLVTRVRNNITPQWGRLANPGFENQRIKTTLFFPGQARDGSARYGCHPISNLALYTVFPNNQEHLNWSAARKNRDGALDQMAAAGLNVVTMSSWGEDFLPCSIGWAIEAPMQTAPGAHDELFAAAVGKALLITPLIESRADWNLRNEFPTWTDGRVAPGTVSQIINLIERYLKNADHPEWAEQWTRVYDRNRQARYAVALIHAASNRLNPRAVNAHHDFAAGFDQIAAEVFAATGIRVGFLIDPLPPNSNAPGQLKPDPSRTGPALRSTDAILGIQAFIPEIWLPNPSDDQDLIDGKREFSRRWSRSGIPFLMDISPGYDAHIVFPGSIQYGLTSKWRHALSGMVMEFGDDGLVFNSWNGYTEAMTAVPTKEFGDTYYRWLTAACALVGQ
jgi:hypothetical protein